MKYVKHTPPKPKTVHEFVLTEVEARYVRRLLGELSNRKIAEILGETLEAVSLTGGTGEVSYGLFDELDCALNRIDDPRNKS